MAMKERTDKNSSASNEFRSKDKTALISTGHLWKAYFDLVEAIQKQLKTGANG